MTDDALSVLRDALAKSAAGLKTHGGIKYQTEVQRLTGLMPAGSGGINHREWAELNLCLLRFLIIINLDIVILGIATDGVVVLLVVTIVI